MRTITNFTAERDRLARARYGVIECRAGELFAIHLKPWPMLFSFRELWPLGDRYHAAGEADRCRLFYNQPRGHNAFLALRYVVTTSGTSYATLLAAQRALDALAELKRIDAVVCEAFNGRLTDRFMRRLGWEPHAPMSGRRNFIRRFYGSYPASGGLL